MHLLPIRSTHPSAGLPAAEKLRILSLGRNNIKKLENLDGIADRLEELWMSYNPIDKLTGIEKLRNLKVLFMGNCKVSSDKELMRLADLPNLEELVFFGNPIHRSMIEKEGELAWPAYILNILPNLRKLDGISMVEWKQKMSGGNDAQVKEVFEKIAKGESSVPVADVKEALKDTEVAQYLSLSPAEVEAGLEKMEGSGAATVTVADFANFFGK